MKRFSSTLAFAIAALVATAANAQSYAFKKPLTGSASSNSSCEGMACSRFAAAILAIQQAKAGTGQVGNGGGNGTSTTPPDNTAQDRALATTLVAKARWTGAYLLYYTVTQGGGCGDYGYSLPDSAGLYASGSSSCTTLQIGAFRQPTWGTEYSNLSATISTEASRPGVCAQAATMGASCSGTVITVSVTAASVTASATPETLADTTESINPGAAP